MKGYEPYWVLPLDGDPIPTVGSGFRQVWVHITKAGVVYLKAPHVDGRVKLTMAQWLGIAHTPNTGQSLSTAITALRRYYLACDKETCNG